MFALSDRARGKFVVHQFLSATHPANQQTTLSLVKNPDLPSLSNVQFAMDTAGVPLRTTEPIEFFVCEGLLYLLQWLQLKY